MSQTVHKIHNPQIEQARTVISGIIDNQVDTALTPLMSSIDDAGALNRAICDMCKFYLTLGMVIAEHQAMLDDILSQTENLSDEIANHLAHAVEGDQICSTKN